MSVRKRNREAFQAAVAFAATLECRHLTGLPGVFHDGISTPADWELAVQEALWRTTSCAGAGLQYAVEPHFGSICDSVDSTIRFVGDVPGLTLTLDYGHFVFNGTPSEQVHRLACHASHVHARAGARSRLQARFCENQIDFEGAIAGARTGRVPWHDRA